MEKKYYNKQAELFGFDMIEQSKEKFNLFYDMSTRKNKKNAEKYYKHQQLLKLRI